MGVKTVIILLLVIALAVFLLTTESGKKYISFLQDKLGELTKGVQVIRAGETFITLSTSPKELRGKTFSTMNSTLQGYGVFKEIFYEKTKITKMEEVGINLTIEKGSLTFTKDEGIRIFVLSNRVEFGDFQLIPEKPVEVSIEVEPINFTISNIRMQDMVLEKIKGELKGAKGSVIVLDEKDVSIAQFAGNLNYINQTVILSGNATKVLINGNDITNII